ncbi:MAG: DNA internalization-related competence protein ComEC/Rec2 [Chloroflexi bacterium]|nr:MAG: DNA internalization-related competence protein ComEC/Rec2 [Chloroflexota bacterium]
MIIVYLAICWFLGIWLASICNMPFTLWLILAGVSLIGTLLFRKRRIALLFACIAVVGFGGLRYETAVPTINQSHAAFYNDTEPITFTGLVVDEPNVRDRITDLRVDVDTLIQPDGKEMSINGKVLVQTFHYPVIDYGTRIKVTGMLETPPENEDFSYKDYLARQDIHSLLFLPQIEVLAENEGNPIYHTIFAIKRQAHATINQLIAEPQASLLAGILLGNDNGLPPDLDQAFRVTGMTHIIAISGFNIAIIIMVLMSISRPFLGDRYATLFATTGIILYTILVGADASVVRASIMGSVFLFTSRWLGRPGFSVATLLVAGWVMTVIRPFLLWDVGFQLSFAATLSLILYADPLAKQVRFRLRHYFDHDATDRLMGLLTEPVIITLSAQLLTLPLMMGHFGQLSLISLLANALILPAQPGVMLWGGLATIVGLFSPAAGQIFGWIAWLFLSYTIQLVEMLAMVPKAAVSVNITWTGVIFIYLTIAAGTWLMRQEKRRRQQIADQLRQNLTQRVALGSSLIGALLVISWGTSQPDGNLHIVFFDVGQGDATFIQTPSGRQILIDGGLYPSILNEALGTQMPFWDRDIDLMIATHPDADHVSGLVDVFERYQVDQLITDGSGAGESEIFDALLEAAAETAVHHALAGERIEIDDGVTLEILHPSTHHNNENRNENSVSMRLLFGDFSYLFTGDAEQLAEQTMLKSGAPLNTLVYKAGHHGSRTSSTMPFLQAAHPQIIIISAGEDNRFGHPHPQTLERAVAIGATTLRTDELGSIELTTNGKTMWWQALP